MKRILFVCTGNTCRSPMAEYMLKNKLEKMGINNVEVQSAGLSAFFPQPPTKNAILVMKEVGIDISKHISKLISEELVKNSSIILTMEKYHKESIVSIYAGAMDKVFTLKEFVNGEKTEQDIADPFGKSIEEYRKCRDEINELLNKLVAKVDDL